MDKASSTAAIFNGLYMLSVCGLLVFAGDRLKAGLWRRLLFLTIFIPSTIKIARGLYPSAVGAFANIVEIVVEAVGILLVAYLIFRRDRLLPRSTGRSSNG